MKKCFWLLAIGCWLFVSCTSSPTDVTKVDKLPEIYPDYIDVTVPVGIAPLNFNMTDEDIDCRCRRQGHQRW